jgi:hypothetical protein
MLDVLLVVPAPVVKVLSSNSCAEFALVISDAECIAVTNFGCCRSSFAQVCLQLKLQTTHVKEK